MPDKSEVGDNLSKAVYEVKDIQDMLGIGRTTAYNLVRKAHRDEEPFRVVKIGDKYRVSKESFNRWLNE